MPNTYTSIDRWVGIYGLATIILDSSYAPTRCSLPYCSRTRFTTTTAGSIGMGLCAVQTRNIDTSVKCSMSVKMFTTAPCWVLSSLFRATLVFAGDLCFGRLSSLTCDLLLTILIRWSGWYRKRAKTRWRCPAIPMVTVIMMLIVATASLGNGRDGTMCKMHDKQEAGPIARGACCQ